MTIAHSPALLARHLPATEVCFGEGGARDAGQLAAYAEAIGRAFGVRQRGERVVLACRDRYRFSATLIAALQHGLLCVLPESSQPEALLALQVRLGASHIVHDLPELSAGIDVRVLEHPEDRQEVLAPLSMSLSELAFIALTSGSTGVPTPHDKTLGQLLIEADTHAQSFALAGCRVVSAVPAHHIYGLLFGVLSPLLSGGSMLRETPLFPATLTATLAAHGAAVLVAVPAHLSALAREPDLSLPPLKRAFSSAGPLPPSVAEALTSRGMAITEIFGATELGGVASRCSPKEPWCPMPGVQIRVAEDDRLAVRSAWSDAGTGAWTETSDRVALAEGGFRHLGRADAVVKIGGRRVDLRDIELQLERAPEVHEARVLAIHHEGSARDTSIWAVVAGQEATVEGLRKVLAERFNQVTWPRRFRFVERLPRSEAGKITRASLLALFDDPAPGIEQHDLTVRAAERARS